MKLEDDHYECWWEGRQQLDVLTLVECSTTGSVKCYIIKVFNVEWCKVFDNCHYVFFYLIGVYDELFNNSDYGITAFNILEYSKD